MEQWSIPFSFLLLRILNWLATSSKTLGFFVVENPELHLTRYGEILEECGLEWSTQSMSGAIVEDLDAKVVCALIVGAVRAERFCDGALLNFFKNGSMMRWLCRLQEINEYTNNDTIGEKERSK